MKAALNRPVLIRLHSNVQSSGKLTFFEGSKAFPFALKRSFWISGVPEGKQRGVHAHKMENQLLICLHGAVIVKLECLDKKHFEFELDHADKALVLPPLIWSSVTFGKGAVLLVLADQPFDEADYIREKAVFEQLQEHFLNHNSTENG
jgi:hypothetical protein